VNALAHIFEAAGLATAAIVLVRPIAERMCPPRALYCEFPFGRPLGPPRDPAYQHRVLGTLLALFDAESGPLLADFPEVVDDGVDQPLACPIPPAFDPSIPPCVAEATGLRPAYDRAQATLGRTQVGRIASAQEIPQIVDRFARIANGHGWADVGFKDAWNIAHAAMDVRAYYEEVALGLSNHVPAARAAESWFYGQTESGAILRVVAQRLMSDSNSDLPSWLPLVLVPVSQLGSC